MSLIVYSARWTYRSAGAACRQTAAPQPTKPVATILPEVDVWEDAVGITLTADLPGVSNKGLSVRVDNDALLIDGDTSLDMPEGMEALYIELRTPRSRRSLALSRELDTARIDAKLKDGVLNVTCRRRRRQNHTTPHRGA